MESVQRKASNAHTLEYLDITIKKWQYLHYQDKLRLSMQFLLVPFLQHHLRLEKRKLDSTWQYTYDNCSDDGNNIDNDCYNEDIRSNMMNDLLDGFKQVDNYDEYDDFYNKWDDDDNDVVDNNNEYNNDKLSNDAVSFIHNENEEGVILVGKVMTTKEVVIYNR